MDFFFSFFLFVNTRTQNKKYSTSIPSLQNSECHDPTTKFLSTPENSETLSQHKYFLEPFLSSDINKFPMEVSSLAIQRT